jgi:hypothetical protein
MAQYACTELKTRRILATVFLAIFAGLLGVGVTIPITVSR